jgi:hypothetical protein
MLRIGSVPPSSKQFRCLTDLGPTWVQQGTWERIIITIMLMVENYHVLVKTPWVLRDGSIVTKW